jgi:hypothetical protein
LAGSVRCSLFDDDDEKRVSAIMEREGRATYRARPKAFLLVAVPVADDGAEALHIFGAQTMTLTGGNSTLRVGVAKIQLSS